MSYFEEIKVSAAETLIIMLVMQYSNLNKLEMLINLLNILSVIRADTRNVYYMIMLMADSHSLVIFQANDSYLH